MLFLMYKKITRINFFYNLYDGYVKEKLNINFDVTTVNGLPIHTSLGFPNSKHLYFCRINVGKIALPQAKPYCPYLTTLSRR